MWVGETFRPYINTQSLWVLWELPRGWVQTLLYQLASARYSLLLAVNGFLNRPIGRGWGSLLIFVIGKSTKWLQTDTQQLQRNVKLLKKTQIVKKESKNNCKKMQNKHKEAQTTTKRRTDHNETEKTQITRPLQTVSFSLRVLLLCRRVWVCGLLNICVQTPIV